MIPLKRQHLKSWHILNGKRLHSTATSIWWVVVAYKFVCHCIRTPNRHELLLVVCWPSNANGLCWRWMHTHFNFWLGYIICAVTILQPTCSIKVIQTMKVLQCMIIYYTVCMSLIMSSKKVVADLTQLAWGHVSQQQSLTGTAYEVSVIAHDVHLLNLRAIVRFEHHSRARAQIFHYHLSNGHSHII